MIINRKLLTAAMTLALAAAALPALADETVTVTKGTHHYVYYRDHEIYFAPESKTYYWMSNGKWQSGPVLPTESQRYISGSGVSVDLDTERPYERHEYVVSHYKNDPAEHETTTTQRTTSDNGTVSTTTTTTKYKYTYYGDHDIYFAPETKIYYWNSDGKWLSGTELPADSRAYVRSGGVAIELDTEHPYERNEYVIAHYKNKH